MTTAQPTQKTSMSTTVFDRAGIRRTRNRAYSHIQNHRFLLDWVSGSLKDRLADIKREFPIALQIGSRTTQEQDKQLCETGHITSLFHIDMAENFLADKTSNAIQGDEEFLPFAKDSLDLVTSPLALHSVNDLPGALAQINYALKPDGLFLAAMLGGETLYELRQVMQQAELNIRKGVSPRIAPFADKQQMGALLQRAGFALPVVDSDIITVTYDHPFKLMHDLRFMGEGNNITERSRTPATKALMAETIRLYQEQFSEPDGRITASFEIIFLIGWSPHQSQQQPLKPGSAQQRLASVLNTKEIETGEKATP